eukprot:scaffold117568_cov66-Phaeocystis_antarctica.AAC.1
MNASSRWRTARRLLRLAVSARRHWPSVRSEASVSRADPSCIAHATTAATSTHQSSAVSSSEPDLAHIATVPGPIVLAVSTE